MTTQWIDLAAIDDIPEDDVIGVDSGGKSIALYHVEGTIYATDNICTHGNARLCDGFVEGHEIECPLHQACFDVRSGQALSAPATIAIATYEVKCECGEIFVRV
jgi:naphthalene 1,2-dioxygenase system ferredoxin subunit